jgi:hypothetical protein
MTSDQTPPRDPRLDDLEYRRGWIENIQEFIDFYVPLADESGIELESLDKMTGHDLVVLSAAVDMWKEEKWPDTDLLESDDLKPH